MYPLQNSVEKARRIEQDKTQVMEKMSSDLAKG